ncbi:hypothetical protein [Ktedonobacter racemifer]|nr:hypothetical protein [Ktedonobacter racemifer]
MNDLYENIAYGKQGNFSYLAQILGPLRKAEPGVQWAEQHNSLDDQ